MGRRRQGIRVNERIRKLENNIREIKNGLRPATRRPPVKIGNAQITVKRATIEPNFTCKTVLTDSTWRYVEIFLHKSHADEALFYWEQAINFFEATKSLSLVSAPLTIYYSMLNASKALLKFHNFGFQEDHGVSGDKADGHFTLQNELVRLHRYGIASSLSRFLKESIPADGVEYNLKLILNNLQYIHRAYHLTYQKQPELFVPILYPRFVHDKNRQLGWFEAQLEPEYSKRVTINKLIGFSHDEGNDNSKGFIIARNQKFPWVAPRNNPTNASLDSLNRYHWKIRSSLRYIYSHENLWYIKRKDLRNSIINRSTLPLTFIAMHRLSEMARYDPKLLKRHLDGKAGWLLSEFISKSLVQFIDEISSEITGFDFRMTGFRV